MTGIILMTYGSATTSANVSDYLRSVYRGQEPKAEVVTEFKRRFDLIGRSPLIDITLRQAQLVEELINRTRPGEFVVAAGMQHLRPSIDEAVADVRQRGATCLRGIVLSPQFSRVIMSGYEKMLRDAAARHGFAPSDVVLAGPWPTQPDWLKFVATSLADMLAQTGPAPVIFTTHSLPKRVLDNDFGYLEQLSATTQELLKLTKLRQGQWWSAYQSAGHSPEEWLKPDLVDIFPEIKQAGHKSVIIVPIQFLSDHLEILYDIDIAARSQCDDFGIRYNRVKLPNTDPLFIQALATIAQAAD